MMMPVRVYTAGSGDEIVMMPGSVLTIHHLGCGSQGSEVVS